VLVEHAAKVRVFQTVQLIYSAQKIQSIVYLSKLLHAHGAHMILVHIATRDIRYKIDDDKLICALDMFSYLICSQVQMSHIDQTKLYLLAYSEHTFKY
jgi:ferredoxin-NADP reductase